MSNENNFNDNELDPSKLTLGDLFARLNISQLWKVISGFFALLLGAFFLGQFVEKKTGLAGRISCDLENVLDRRYDGLWIYRIKVKDPSVPNKKKYIPVFAVMEVIFNSKTCGVSANGRVWHDDIRPTITNWEGIWEDEGITVKNNTLNIIFDIEGKSCFTKGENPKCQFSGILRLPLSRDFDSLSGTVEDFSPRSTTGDFEAIRARSSNWNGAIIEAGRKYGPEF